MLITVGRYDFPYEAHLARTRLEAEGIPAFVADEHTINMNWLYTFAMGGVRLQVPEQFSERATAVLGEDRSKDLEVEESTDQCPGCGANAMHYYLKGKRIAYLMFILLQFPLWPTKPTRKCDDCGYVEGGT